MEAGSSLLLRETLTLHVQRRIPVLSATPMALHHLPLRSTMLRTRLDHLQGIICGALISPAINTSIMEYGPLMVHPAHKYEHIAGVLATALRHRCIGKTRRMATPTMAVISTPVCTITRVTRVPSEVKGSGTRPPERNKLCPGIHV